MLLPPAHFYTVIQVLVLWKDYMLQINRDYLEVWREPSANIMPLLHRSMDIFLSVSVFVTLFLNTGIIVLL